MVVELTFWDMILRISVAALCGGLIGIERGKKHRPAGFRTHMLVCMGAALTMVLSTYLSAMLTNVWQIGYTDATRTDVSRFGAQVINGIGFLGAGTIIVTGRQQIKGMTTAAGLWASACLGLAVGTGFYSAALICCGLIVLTIIVFSKIERIILSRSRNVTIYVEFENTDNIVEIFTKLKDSQVRIFDAEITKAKYSETKYPNVILTLQLPKKMPHTHVFTLISEMESIRSIDSALGTNL